jgi:prohibitin 1
MKNVGFALVVLFFVFFFLGSSLVGFTVIEDGEAGVRADFGKIASEPVGTGWHFYFRPISWIERWNIKTREIKEQARVPSSEGLISSLDVSILYNITRENVVRVRTMIGRNFAESVLEPYIREAIRNVISGYEVKALYSEQGRKEIGGKIAEFLKEKLTPRGIEIQDVLLRDVTLPAAFAQSIEAKLRTEQESLQKQFELVKAKKDAEIEIARAEGVAKANVIIAGSLSDSYLKYQWIQGLQKNDLQVVYVPTEASLPIMEASRWGAAKTEK